jgi:hypothetical protein
MNSISSSNASPRPRIEKLLSDIGQLKNQVDRLEQGYIDIYSVDQRASQDLQSMKWPLRNAERDNAQTDVSFEGRQAQMNLDSAERNLRDNDFKYSRQRSGTQTADGGFSASQNDLKAIIADSASYPAALAKLQQSEQALSASSQDHKDAKSEGGWAENDHQRTTSELRWAENDVRQVSYDSPGRDVSYDARRASQRVDQAEWSLRDSSSKVSNAQGEEAKSERGLVQVENLLREALQNLPA